jgi:predicted DsbA family dithiol-disulfide isomerase
MQMPVDVRYYTDPACTWSWGTEPKLRRLMWEFGDGLRFAWVMGGLARQYGPDYRDEESGVEALVGEGAAAGLDLGRFRIDISSNAITETFAADLDEVRNYGIRRTSRW